MTREEAIDILVRLPLLHMCTRDTIDKVSDALNMAIEALEEQRPHGEWIKGKEISRTMLCDKTLHIDYKDFTCSVCGIVLDRLLYHVDGSPFYKFCPNCGALMSTNDRQVTGKLKQPCPCDTCQTAIDRCGCQMHLCSDYQKWKEGGEK